MWWYDECCHDPNQLTTYEALDSLYKRPLEGHSTHETEGPWPLHFKHSHWWKKADLVQVRFTLRSRNQRSMWMQDGCKVYMDYYMASNGSCFMVIWIIFKNHLLEAGLTQNQEIVALQTFTTVDLFYFIMGWGPAWMKFIEIAWGWGPSHVWLQTTLEVHDHITWFWRCLEMAFGHFLLGSHNFMVITLGSWSHLA